MINKYMFEIKKYENEPRMWVLRQVCGLLDVHKAYFYVSRFEKDYPTAKIGVANNWSSKDQDFDHLIYFIFEDDADEAEFIMREMADDR